MLFEKPDDFLKAPRHAVTVFGMSGVGKTRLSAVLQRGGWFHYSVDYRIGTRYMGEFIVDNFKREAMKVPFLRDLLRSDSIYLNSNITFDNLEPLSTYLGAPGDPARGGLTLAEYQRRQNQHRHRRDLGAARRPRLHRAGARDLRLRRLHLRHRRLADRGDRPRQRRGPGGQGADRSPPPCSTSAAPRRTPRARRAASRTRRSRCTTSPISSSRNGPSTRS